MDPRSYPSDELFDRWSHEYGTTGVKTYELGMHTSNEDCIAVFREASMADRARMARFDEVERISPGSYETMQMFVSSMLLYPRVEDYPEPAYAVAELFKYFRQYGHGALTEDEPHSGVEVDEDQNVVHAGIPEHIVRDFRNARQAAKLVFEDPRYATFYRNIIIELATTNGILDPIAFDTLCRMPLGRLRDLVARTEQAHMLLRSEAFSLLDGIKDSRQRAEAAQRIDQIYATPLAALDEASRGATIPDVYVDDPEEVEDEVYTPDDSLPPNAPPPFSKADLLRDLEGST